MIATRVIPCLLLLDDGLVKTVKFKDPKYLGDPINIVRLFNDKEVDELVFLDITATIERRPPPFELLEQIASECFIPFGYGGGVHSVEDARRILALGVEKIVVNTAAVETPSLLRKLADFAGSQSVVASVDVRLNQVGKYEVFTHGGRQPTGLDPVKLAVDVESYGAGELLLNSIDRDGTMEGYDLALIQQVARAVNIPVVACGGARTVQDLAAAVKDGGASAASAGSMFVYQGKHRAVLISYPSRQHLRAAFGE